MQEQKQGPSKISLWEHGSHCAEALNEILSGEAPKEIQEIPWLQEAISSFPREDLPQILTYLQWHDLGKITTRIVTPEGKIQYPGHAEESSKLWLDAGGHENIARWMRQDMLFHSGTQEECKKLSAEDWKIHRLCAAAEILSNTRDGIFGPEGFQSDSFKIKRKKLIRNGRILL